MKKVKIGNVKVDQIDISIALRTISDCIYRGKGGKVFTPNVDHIIMCEHDSRLREAYSRATMCLADGQPLIWASRLMRKPLQKISGSDFIFPLLKMSERKQYRVFLLGSTPNTIQKAIDNIKKDMPRLNIVGHMSPFVSSTPSKEEVAAIMADVSSTEPDIIIVALGAPKQEFFIDLAHTMYKRGIFFGFGASLNYVAGDLKRAPKWMQKSGLEWAYRLAQEPKRLCSRYLRDMKFPIVIFKSLICKTT